MAFLHSLGQLLRFLHLPREQRRIVFYSEGRAYWGHLQPLLQQLLDASNIPICYITSGSDDPGLKYTHERFQAFATDEGWIRNWLFENIDTDIMLMTMPDLNQYQIKRSRYPVHYVYLQHSLVSLHLSYREGAFDHFDTVLCSAPHHRQEIKAMEAFYQLPEKHTIDHSYNRLYQIIDEAKRQRRNSKTGSGKHVLIAPTWGQHGLIETTAAELPRLLLENGFTVTLRPHPQTSKFATTQLAAIASELGDHPRFTLETDVSGQESLQRSDIMISDWSGAALEYAFGLGKPLLFIDLPLKVHNPNYQKIGLTPFEQWVRSKIGRVLPLAELSSAPAVLSEMLASNTIPAEIDCLRRRHLFDPSCDHKAVKHILELLKNAHVE